MTSKKFCFIELIIALVLCDCVHSKYVFNDGSTSIGNKSDLSNDQTLEYDSQVIEDLISSPKKIGEIEFDIEVQERVTQHRESKATEIVVTSQKSDTLLSNSSQNDKDVNDFKIKNFAKDLKKSFDSQSTEDDLVLKDTSPEDSVPNDSVPEDTAPEDLDSVPEESVVEDSNLDPSANGSLALNNSTPNGLDSNDSTSGTTTLGSSNSEVTTTELSTTESIDINSANDITQMSSTTEKSEKKSSESPSIWIFIIVGLILTVLALVGLYCCISFCCKTKTQLNSEEKQKSVKSADNQSKPVDTTNESPVTDMTQNNCSESDVSVVSLTTRSEHSQEDKPQTTQPVSEESVSSVRSKN